ncbi:MAG: toxin-antitoxin system HicB family antitoxin [Sporichthyaceae bacterium]
MQLQPYVAQVQAQLLAAAALGDQQTRTVAVALSAAAEPAIRLALLGASSAAADEITAALLDAPGAPAVSVRIDGDEVRVEVRSGQPAPEPEPVRASADEDNSARISLRLPEGLKGRVEEAARAEGISTNAWILRALDASLAAGWSGPRPGTGRPGPQGGHRITGWING